MHALHVSENKGFPRPGNRDGDLKGVCCNQLACPSHRLDTVITSCGVRTAAETSGVIFNAAKTTWKCDGMTLAPCFSLAPPLNLCAISGNTKHEANLLRMKGSLFV